jgi:translation initiation factor IF-3
VAVDDRRIKRESSLSRDLRVNEMIRIPQVRVVDEEGAQLGVMPTPQALQLAQDRGFDLVEVAPMAVPPVVRLLDYGQFKYEQARRDKEARRNQRSVEFKEIRLKPKIGKGDFDTKVRRAIQFLEDGDRVKVTVQFRGREVSHSFIGRDLLTRFGELIREHGAVERQPILEGKSMSMVVTSTHKPKLQPPTGRAEGQPAQQGEVQPPRSPQPGPAPQPARSDQPAPQPARAAQQAPPQQAARPAQPAARPTDAAPARGASPAPATPGDGASRERPAEAPGVADGRPPRPRTAAVPANKPAGG